MIDIEKQCETDTWRLVSFYTAGNGYDREAERLVASCERLGLPLEITAQDDAGGWVANCAMKARYCLEKLLAHQSPIVWIDADAVACRYPVLFDTLKGDIAYAVWTNNQPLAGTVWFNYTPGAVGFLREWTRRCESDLGHDDQFHFIALLGEQPVKATILPYDYTYITGVPKSGCHPVFQHYQASNRLRDHLPRAVTALMYLRIDHPDTLENAEVVVKLLPFTAPLHLWIVEEGVTPKAQHLGEYAQYQFEYASDAYTHRAKYFNNLASRVTTPIMALMDGDVMLTPSSHRKAVKRLTTSQGQMCYPYSRFLNVDRSDRNQMVSGGAYDFDPDHCVERRGLQQYTGGISVGGMVYYQTDAFWRAGGENENIVGYGPDDLERYFRAKKLGFNIVRTNGDLYHLPHAKGLNGRLSHEHQEDNWSEFLKIYNMNMKDLKKYIASWNYYSVQPGRIHTGIATV